MAVSNTQWAQAAAQMKDNVEGNMKAPGIRCCLS